MRGYWDWLETFEAQAVAERDREKVRLARLRVEAYALREKDPGRALSLFREGAALARQLDQPWWALLYDKWVVHASMHFLRDYRDVLDRAVANTLEVRKPLYNDFPQRFDIYEDLAVAYMGIDPEGYEEAILQVLESIDRDLPPGLEFRRHLLVNHRRDLFLELDRLDDAETAARAALELVASERNAGTANHYAVFVLCGLCQVAHRRGDWEGLGHWAGAGDEAARTAGHKMERAELWMWMATLLRQAGRHDLAQKQYHLALRWVGQLGMPPTPGLDEAQHAYYQAAGEIEYRAALYRRQLESVRDRGRLHYETRLRVGLCRALAATGSLTVADLAEARLAAQQLKKPGRHLAELGELDAGDSRP